FGPVTENWTTGLIQSRITSKLWSIPSRELEGPGILMSDVLVLFTATVSLVSDVCAKDSESVTVTPTLVLIGGMLIPPPTETVTVCWDWNELSSELLVPIFVLEP